MRTKKAWGKQKELQKEFSGDEVPDINYLADMIRYIRYGKRDIKFQTLRARALVSAYYLTAARETEIITITKLRRSKTIRKKFRNRDNKIIVKKRTVRLKPEKINYGGLRKKDIKIKRIEGKLFLSIWLDNRKNKRRKRKRLLCPIEFEKSVAKHLIKYRDMFKNDNDRLFKFRKSTACKIVRETTGFNIHFLRHIRATHLITRYDFNEQMLVKFMGWTDSRPAKHYIELRTKDLARSFYK